MKKLTVDVLPEPEALAEWCVRQGHVAWGERNCCPFPATECPLGRIGCLTVTPEHWKKVLGEDGQEPEPEPEMPFRFGDKVTLTNSTGSYNGVFNAYTEHGRAYVLLEGEDRCSTEIVSNLKAGWE